MKLGNNLRHRVCALIVTYRPDFDQLALLIDRLNTQVGAVVLVSNGELRIPLAMESRFSKLSKIIVNEENIGIAAAQNQGLEAIEALPEMQYVLLMDDDSLPGTGMVDALLVALNRPEARDAAAAGPASIDLRTGDRSLFVIRRGRSLKSLRPDSSVAGFIEVGFLIASGTLIRLDLLRQIGGMRSHYFIDHVDTEWCLRCRAHGFTLLGVVSAELGHRLGDNVTRFWFLRWRKVAHHTPLRDYYMFRNTLLMIKELNLPFFWRIHFLGRLVQFAVFFGLFGDDRMKRLRMMCLGLWHGLRNFSGKLDPKTLRLGVVRLNKWDPPFK